VTPQLAIIAGILDFIEVMSFGAVILLIFVLLGIRCVGEIAYENCKGNGSVAPSQ
jgi:hypothetical protein